MSRERKERLGGKLEVHNRVKALRVERDVTRRELADALGIEYRALGYMEPQDYTPSLELAWRIAEFFQLPMEAVFSKEPFPPMNEQLYGRDEDRVTR